MARRKPPVVSVESAVLAHVDGLRAEGLDTTGEAYAQVALSLARLLDRGEPVMMTGTWARELRATLLVLGQGRSDGDDDSSWLNDLPAAVRNSS